MSPAVYGTPYTPPPAPGPKWPGLSMTWTGPDGKPWTLTDDASGVYLPRAEVGGLSKPRRERYTSSSPARPGARPRGTRVLPRPVWWPIEVYTDGGSDAWLDLDAAFFRSLDSDHPGVWRVTRPNGHWRELEMYFEDDGDHAFVPDPSRVGWEVYELNFIALDPLWRGEPILAGPWRVGPEDESFFPGPPYYIGSSSTAGIVPVTNPGDFEAWPIWRVTGPVTSMSATVAGQTIEVAFEVPEGSELVIDTDQQVALLDGENVTTDLAQIGFEPIPPRGTTQVSVQLVGAGEVSCSIVPLYERAW